MKQSLRSLLALTLMLLVLAVGFPAGVSAAKNGDGITATDILTPVNPNASRESKNLLAYMQSLNGTNRFVTGTFDYGNSSFVYDQIKEQFGVEPGLYSCRYYVSPQRNYAENGVTHDFLEFYHVDTANAQLKEHYDNGNILLIHADSVISEVMQNYADAAGIAGGSADLIIHLDATNPDRDMVLYNAWMLYQKNLVSSLAQLESMGVKAYMYRPWVEYNYGPMYGATREGYDAMRRVWQQTTQYMCDSGLTGFLMTYAPGADSSVDMQARYPGNAYVDVLSVTFYGNSWSTTPGMGGYLSSSSFQDYAWYVRTGKPIGLSETSCRTGDWQIEHSTGRQSWYNTLTSMLTYWPGISWVNCWGDGSYSLLNETNGSRSDGNDDGYLYMNSPYSITLEQMPDYRSGIIAAPGVVQLYTEKNYGGNDGKIFVSSYVGLEEKTYSAAGLRALGIDPVQIASFHINDGYGIVCYDGDNATGNSWTYVIGSDDATALSSAGKIRSIRVIPVSVISRDCPRVTASANEENAWKAVDGELARWSAESDANGQGWLKLDLGSAYAVSRWVVLHASTLGSPDTYNTADFALQYSLDGVNWISADSVTGNRSGKTDRSLSATMTARYFRLLITRASSLSGGIDANIINIVEWTLYGLPAEEIPDGTSGGTIPGTVPEINVGEPDKDIIPAVDDSAGLDPAPAADDGADGDTADKSEDEDSGSGRRKVQKTIVEGYFPWWGWALIAVGAVAVIGGISLAVVRLRKRRPQ